MRLLVVATQNRGKLAELRALLAGLEVRVRSVADVLARSVDVVEDGDTFEANALKKARAIADLTNELTLADDSGLCVDALGGAPGVRSARYAHEHATDAENNAALVRALTPPAHENFVYSARFRCVLALVDPRAATAPLWVEGDCEGAITLAPRGDRGFGYDPYFVVAGGTKTMAELSDAEKNLISHRARAFQALRPALEGWLRSAPRR